LTTYNHSVPRGSFPSTIEGANTGQANLEWVIDHINGTINQSPNQLHLDIEQAIDHIDNQNKYQQLCDFNHNLIGQKAKFSDNILKFIELYVNLDKKDKCPA
jgi:hypothetical protein